MLKSLFNEAQQGAKFSILRLSLRPQVLFEGSTKGGCGMVIRVAAILVCLGLCLCAAMVSVCNAGGPAAYPEAYCAPAPCGPPPCAPPACGPSPFSFCGGILSACTGVCGAVIGIPAAIMGGILAPPRMPVNNCAPPMCGPPPCPPQMCGPAPCPQPITKCKPVACGPGYPCNAGGYR
jgi:hypothetical protein